MAFFVLERKYLAFLYLICFHLIKSMIILLTWNAHIPISELVEWVSGNLPQFTLGKYLTQKYLKLAQQIKKMFHENTTKYCIWKQYSS